MRFAEEVIVPFPPTMAAEPVATHCRGTMLLASLNTVRARGHFDRYARVIEPTHLTAMTGALANSWVPVDVALGHYRACDALGLPPEEILTIGGEVVRAVQRTFLGTVLRSASAGMGISTLTGIEKFASVYGRTIKGGGARIVRIGPKDARVEIAGLPLAAIRYFRVSYRGFLQAGCEFFARRVVIAELDAYLSPLTIGYRVAWA